MQSCLLLDVDAALSPHLHARSVRFDSVAVMFTYAQRQAVLQLKLPILENVAIANALQLEAARCRAVPISFNFVSRAKFEVAQPIRCRFRAFLLLIRYVTL